MITTVERFQGAALSLARSGSIKDRLTDAYRNHLALIEADELPHDVQGEFRAFNDAVTRERPLLRGEDAFRATIRKMSNFEADQAASSIVRMFAALTLALARAEASSNVLRPKKLVRVAPAA
jgi:hypothetical protein